MEENCKRFRTFYTNEMFSIKNTKNCSVATCDKNNTFWKKFMVDN